MFKLEKKWLKYSLKKKIACIILLLVLTTLVTEIGTVGLTWVSLGTFEKVLNNHFIYYELEDALQQEESSFIAYIRNRSDENRMVYEMACQKTEKSIAELPFDYKKIGEERYARTWNLIHGYEGYKISRDEVLYMGQQDASYIEKLYEVMSMQESLAEYSSRLVQVTLAEADQMYDERMSYLRVIPILVLAVILLTMWISQKLWRLITKTVVIPLVLMAEDSRNIVANDFDTPQIQVQNEDEIGELVIAFNKMKVAMKDYIETLKEKNRISELLHQEEMNLKAAQLATLKNQINPHFLFNTLNMISNMANLEDAEITEKMILSLSNLFRYNLRTVEQEVSLEQELQVLKDYMYIQRMRFGHRLRYEETICVEKDRVYMPSLTLQPLAENAIQHGLSGRVEGGTIQLRVWEEDGRLRLALHDDGEGISQERLREINKNIHEVNTTGRGIGLGNVARRIDMMYEGGKLVVESEEGKGTTILIDIPFKEIGGMIHV